MNATVWIAVGAAAALLFAIDVLKLRQRRRREQLIEQIEAQMLWAELEAASARDRKAA